MNKKYITILILVLLCVTAVTIFFCKKNTREVTTQSWKTVLVVEYGVSIEYPATITARYANQEGAIFFYKGSIADQNVLNSRVMLLTNTQAEHHPDGVEGKEFQKLPDGKVYATAAVYKGDKYVGFNLRDFDEATAEHIINSVKFFDDIK